MAHLGDFSEVKAATHEFQKICDQIKADAEKAAGHKFSVFTAICYKDQIVAGTNYAIMVHVGEKKYGHVKVFESLPCDGGKLQLIGFKYPAPTPLPE